MVKALRSTSPYSWTSSFDDDNDEDSDGDWRDSGENDLAEMLLRPTTAGSLGLRMIRSCTPVGNGNASKGPNGPSSRPPSPFISASAHSKIKVLKNRDMESLYEEIMKLTQSINHRNLYIRKQKIYSSDLSLQNRRLEKNVDTLEMLGAKGPRTGAPTRLRAVVQGLRLKLAKFETLCESQEEEIFQLERDFRVTSSKELQVERDVYALELGRLNEVAEYLRKSKKKLKHENKEINHMRDKVRMLELANERIEFSTQAMKGSAVKAEQEMESSKHAMEASIREAQEMSRLYRKIREHKTLLEGLVEKERVSKEKLGKRVLNLSSMISRIERQLYELARRGIPIPGLKLKLRGGGTPEAEMLSEEIVKVNRLYGGATTSYPVAVDQSCQTSALLTRSFKIVRRSSPQVPRLNFGKLKPLDDDGDREKVAAEKPVQNHQASAAPPPPAEQDVQASRSTSESSNKSSNKKLVLNSSPSPAPRPALRPASRSSTFSRPPSRLGTLPEDISQVASCSSSAAAACNFPDLAAIIGVNVDPHQRRVRGSRRLKTVSEDDQLGCESWELQRRQQQLQARPSSSNMSNSISTREKMWTKKNSKIKQPNALKMAQARCQRELECLEWLQMLEVPEVEEELHLKHHHHRKWIHSSSRPGPAAIRKPRRGSRQAFAEDTIQLMHLERPEFEARSRPCS